MSNRRLPDDRFKQKKAPKPNTLRLFLGIFPPDEYISYFREVTRALQKEKRNMKYTPLDQIHLTVKFIGSEVSYSSKDILLEDLTRYSGNFIKPEIKVDSIQFGFPYQHDPQHLLVMIEENQSLKDLYNSVHNRLKELRLMDTIRWKGKNSDNFHFTVGKVKPKKSRGLGKEIKDIVNNIRLDPPQPFIAEYMDLVESKMSNAGPVYRKIGRIKL